MHVVAVGTALTVALNLETRDTIRAGRFCSAQWVYHCNLAPPLAVVAKVIGGLWNIPH
jgi:hypothetical protein